MKASETSLRILLEGGKQFQIPLFQRPYSWSKDEWNALWEDLMDVYNDQEEYHFLGSIVTQSAPGTAEGISPFVLIDGQQRLTTLSIFLAVLRDAVQEKDPELASEIQESYLINKFKKEDTRYKVLPTQSDIDLYQNLIDCKLDSQNHIICHTYDFFRKKINSGNIENNTPIDLQILKNVILEKLTLVSITLDDKDNPYIIFESLNHRGAPLTQADLVRNYLFMRAGNKKEQKEVYDNLWFPMQEKFKIYAGESKYQKDLTRSFWCYLRKDGVSVNQKRIYQNLKEGLDNKNTSDLFIQIKEIFRFADYYIRISFPESETEKKLRVRFERLKKLDFKNCHPFILNLYRDYEEQILSLEDFDECLRYIESYFVRRLVAGLTNRWMDQVFNSLYKEVKELQKQKEINSFVDALRTRLIQLPTKSKFPDDDSFRQSIIETPFSDSRGARIKFLLESLEEPLTKFKIDTGGLTLEHIMPRTLTNEWRNEIGENAEELHKRWLNTLGNLTLTPYNSEMSNKPFQEKYPHFKDSSLKLDRDYFKDIKTWDIEQIKHRSAYLAEIAIKVWCR